MKKIHINEYATALLSDRCFFDLEYRKYVDNCYTLPHVEGNISPDILKSVIHKAKWNRKMRRMLAGILWYVDKYSISDEIFQMLLRSPPKYRNTYLEAIAHSERAFYQMQIIYRVTSSFEAFAWLFDRICENDFFQEADMRQLLRENYDITSYGISACIEYARNKFGASSKLSVAEAWLKTNNNTQL